VTLDVTELAKKAAEAAKHVPQHLQEAAFNRAFEALLNADAAPHTRPASRRGKSQAGRNAADTPASDVTVAKLDRTKHPEIGHNDTVLNNALRVLRAAKDDLNIDGLSATAIAKVLVDKFRCRVSRRGVSQALNDAGRYVNRHNEGNEVIFRIMAPGEDYLDSLSSAGEGSRPAVSRRPAKRRGPKRPAKGTSEQSAKSAKKSSSRSKGASGAATAMSHIYDGGFFSSPRTIGDIIENLKHDRGHTFKANELSPVLLRWLRAGKLKRTRNADGQYEYTTG
jgi:hypothetical protein